jgi:hypothetical protein
MEIVWVRRAEPPVTGCRWLRVLAGSMRAATCTAGRSGSCGASPTPPSCRRLHSPVPGPWGPVAAVTAACVVAVPLGSSTRDLLTSGTPLEEAGVVVEVAGAAVMAAAGSSGPTSHTRVTTTGVDELAWAARSCRGLVRAGGRGGGGEEVTLVSGHERAQPTREGPPGPLRHTAPSRRVPALFLKPCSHPPLARGPASGTIYLLLLPGPQTSWYPLPAHGGPPLCRLKTEPHLPCPPLSVLSDLWSPTQGSSQNTVTVLGTPGALWLTEVTGRRGTAGGASAQAGLQTGQGLTISVAG